MRLLATLEWNDKMARRPMTPNPIDPTVWHVLVLAQGELKILFLEAVEDLVDRLLGFMEK